MKRTSKYDTPIRIVCAVLFALFSFLYIYLFQGEQLALIQDHLAQGVTSNNTLITAIIITLLLGGLQHLLNRVGRLHGRFEAISYLPSCVLLALMTKVDSYLSYSLWQWLVTLVVVAAVYLFMVWIERNTLDTRETRALCVLTPNLGAMAVLFVFTGWYSNDSTARQMELAAWKYVHEGNYQKVLSVGARSIETNVNLTALRSLALAKTGRLGDNLFAYPQCYGSDVLLMNRYKVQTPSYGSKAYYQSLGASPYGGEKAADFYKRLMAQYPDVEEYRDLYVAALLLAKNLKDFISVVTQPSTQLTNAPIHYQEALIIYNEQHPFEPISFSADSVIVSCYHDYLTLREEQAANAETMRNLCHRHFGNTYWYYYDFVK
jgi:hypothetical protein